MQTFGAKNFLFRKFRPTFCIEKSPYSIYTVLITKNIHPERSLHMDYQKLAEQRNSTNNFARHVGITTTKIEHGYAEVRMELQPFHLNPTGIVHGGALYTMADVVVGSANASLGTHGVTVDGEYHYLSPAANMKELTAVAKCVKEGGKICVFDVEVLSETGKLIGKGTFTTYRLLDKPIILE